MQAQFAAEPVQIQGIVFFDPVCGHMVLGHHRKLVGDKRGNHQPGLLFACKRRVLESGRLNPGIVHQGLKLWKSLGKFLRVLNQTVEFIHQRMSPHVLLIVHFLKGYRPADHLLHQFPVEADAHALAQVAIPLPLGGVVPVPGETCGVGGVVKFLRQFPAEEGFQFVAFLKVPVLVQLFHHRFTDAVHKQAHLGGIVHIQNIVQPQFRTADDSVKGGKVRIMVQHSLPSTEQGRRSLGGRPCVFRLVAWAYLSLLLGRAGKAAFGMPCPEYDLSAVFYASGALGVSILVPH